MKADGQTSAPEPAWTAWQTLPGLPSLEPAALAEILDGGQAFRWQPAFPGAWLGIWGDCVARLRSDPGGRLQWCAPEPIAARVAAALPAYFASGRDFDALTDALPWRSDSHLARCLAAFPGLRLLRQPFGETLLGFLCSATKQIVQIKQMLSLLAARHGPEICAGHHRLPTWSELARISEGDLRQCLLGFRARHIDGTARFLADHPGWLEETEGLPYPAARARLCALPGVGEKIADCVLLFGAGRYEAFPVDTWILKSLASHYGLGRWKPAQVAQFGRAHFGPHAGLAQQFLFAWERASTRGQRIQEEADPLDPAYIHPNATTATEQPRINHTETQSRNLG